MPADCAAVRIGTVNSSRDYPDGNPKAAKKERNQGMHQMVDPWLGEKSGLIANVTEVLRLFYGHYLNALLAD